MKGLKSAIKWIVAIVIICVVMVFLANINGLHITRTAITVNGSEITEDEIEFYVELAKNQVFSEQGIADEEAAKKFLQEGKVEDKAATDYIKEKALEMAIENEVAIVKAKEAGISLSEDERDAARSTDGMDETIKAYGLTKNSYADIMEKMALSDKYYNFMISGGSDVVAVSDEAAITAIDDSYALVQHVLVANKPEGAEAPDEAYAAEAKKKAEEVLKKAVNGEEFSSLVKTYGEDPGMETNPEGYLIDKDGYQLTLDEQTGTFTNAGMMVPEFTKGAFAVKPNEVNSQLVETEYGWHIIKRCPIIEKYVDYEAVKSDAKNRLISEKYKAHIKSLVSTMTVEKKDKVINKIKVEY